MQITLMGVKEKKITTAMRVSKKRKITWDHCGMRRGEARKKFQLESGWVTEE